MSDQAGVQESVAEAVVQAPEAAPAPVQEDFRAGISEEYREHPSLKDFKDIDGLAKSYISGQSLIGSSIRVPGEDASNEARSDFYESLSKVPGVAKLPESGNQKEIDEFYNKLGRPEEATGYELDGLETAAGPELTTEFKTLAHSLGLNQTQAKALVDFEMSRAPTQEQMELQAQEAKDLAATALKKEWGADFDNRLSGANHVWKQYEGQYPDAMAELKASAGNNPALAVMMAELGKSFNESGTLIAEHKIQYGTSPLEATNKINEKKADRGFMEAYTRASDPGHAAAVAEMSRLYGLANPTE